MTGRPQIPRGDFEQRRIALGEALERRGLAGWIACADDRPFAGGDHVRWLADFQAHFEPVVLAGRGSRALLLTGPESSGLAALDVAGAVDVRAAREFAYPGLEYASIALTDGADALRELFTGVERVALIGGEAAGAGALLGPLGRELVAADDVAYALRAVKTDAEHAVMDAGYRIAVRGHRRGRLRAGRRRQRARRGRRRGRRDAPRRCRGIRHRHDGRRRRTQPDDPHPLDVPHSRGGRDRRGHRRAPL